MSEQEALIACREQIERTMQMLYARDGMGKREGDETQLYRILHRAYMALLFESEAPAS